MAYPTLLFHFSTMGLVPKAVDNKSPIFKPVNLCNMTIRRQAETIAKELVSHMGLSETVQVVVHTSELFSYISGYVTDGISDDLLVCVRHRPPEFDTEAFAFDATRFIKEHI